MKTLRALPILIVIVAWDARAAEGLNVAVASNFLQAASEIAEQYSQSTGVPVRLIPGSTGHLYAQIVAGAPYDVLLAADVARPQALIQRDLAIADTLTIYAVGYLVLWSNNSSYNKQSCYQDFLDGNFRYLAIANPETAPYGEAARRFLQAIERWDTFADKLAYGESVLQAFQFAASGNASLGLVAASHATAYGGRAGEDHEVSCMTDLPEAFVDSVSVEQGGVVTSNSGSRPAAEAFLLFMRQADVVEMLIRRGYRVPARADAK